MERSKLLRKVRRKQTQLRTNEPEMRVTFLDACSATLPAGDEVKYHVFVGNGGTRNGISRELLSTLLGGVDVLYMPESKDFSFATVTGQRKAINLLEHCNGINIQETCKVRELSHLLNPSLLQGPPLHLYLSLVDHIPASVLECNEDAVASGGHGPDLPPGLILIPDFISATEEEDLLSYFGTYYFTTSTFEDSHKQPFLGVPTNTAITDNTTTDKADVTEFVNVNPAIEGDGDPRTHVLSCSTTSRDLSASQPISPPVASTLKHRTVSHYGYEFLYGTNTVDPAHPLPGGLPAICTPLLERLRSKRYLEWLPDQLTVNEYLPGAGKSLYCNTSMQYICIQWNLYTMDTWGQAILSTVEKSSFQRFNVLPL